MNIENITLQYMYCRVCSLCSHENKGYLYSYTETCIVGGYSMPLENTCTVYTCTCMCICMYVHIRIRGGGGYYNYTDTWLHYTSNEYASREHHSTCTVYARTCMCICTYMYVYIHVCTVSI